MASDALRKSVHSFLFTPTSPDSHHSSGLFVFSVMFANMTVENHAAFIDELITPRALIKQL